MWWVRAEVGRSAMERRSAVTASGSRRVNRHAIPRSLSKAALFGTIRAACESGPIASSRRPALIRLSARRRTPSAEPAFTWTRSRRAIGKSYPKAGAGSRVLRELPSASVVPATCAAFSFISLRRFPVLARACAPASYTLVACVGDALVPSSLATKRVCARLSAVAGASEDEHGTSGVRRGGPGGSGGPLGDERHPAREARPGSHRARGHPRPRGERCRSSRGRRGNPRPCAGLPRRTSARPGHRARRGGEACGARRRARAARLRARARGRGA